MKETIPEEILIKLNHTNNPHLLSYRNYRKKNPIKSIFKILVKNLKILILCVLAGNDIKKSYKRRNMIDKLWLICLLKVYKKNVLLSEGSGRKIPFWDGNILCPIDEKIAPIVFALNKMGVRTNNACEGGQPNGHSSTAYISTYPKYKFPKEFLEYLKEENILHNFSEKSNEYIGQSLYAANAKENSNFLEATTKWSMQKHFFDIRNLKHIWKE